MRMMKIFRGTCVTSGYFVLFLNWEQRSIKKKKKNADDENIQGHVCDLEVFRSIFKLKTAFH